MSKAGGGKVGRVSVSPDDHEFTCPFRLAASCAGAVECQHGYDACPTCDPCKCEEPAPRPRRSGKKSPAPRRGRRSPK